jgi:prepilin-type N-terminal cleavage/methylation domain-containing protein
MLRRSERGVSLVELLVVTAIFSVVLMAVFSLLVPTQRSAETQVRVGELQQGLRLALNTMTKDLLMAGFLVLDDPIIFEGGTDAGTDPPSSATDFTIRTRIIGNDFGRVAADAAASANLYLGDADIAVVSEHDLAMDRNLPDGCKVRLFDPLTTNEVTPNGVYTVNNDDLTDGIIQTDYPNPVSAETVIVRIVDTTVPAMQTIRYRVNSGVLERIVNGKVQALASNIAGVNFDYTEWTDSEPPRVRRIDILIQGETRAVANNDVLAGAKEREARTSVTLRNVF